MAKEKKESAAKKLMSPLMPEEGSKSTAKKKRVPRTVQQSIPYSSVCQNGMFLSGDGTYCKSYRIEDTNFTTAAQGEQETIYMDYEGLLNSLGDNMTGKVTVFNRPINPEIIKNRILLHPKNDNLNEYRNEYNAMLLDKMQEGRNNLTKEKYFTVALDADGPEDAQAAFRQVDHDVTSKINRINHKDVVPMTVDERLNVLYDIFNGDEGLSYTQQVSGIKSADGSINLKALNAAGRTTKDLIGPDSFAFSNNYFMIGEKYARAYMLSNNLPSFLSAEILNNITDIPCSMVTSIIYRPIPTKQASSMVRMKASSVNEEVIRHQKRAARDNYSMDIMPFELKQMQSEVDTIRKDMQTRNQKMFLVSVCIVLIADSMEELKQNGESLKSACTGNLTQLRLMAYQQERVFDAALPVGGLNGLEIDRTLTTEQGAVFMPFSVKELSQEHGVYYGLNAISHNLIIYNRFSAKNYNGLILGQPGSGKSFISKSEIITTLLSSNDDVFVIDPEGEYKTLAQAFGGEVLRIAVGSDTNINPLDMDLHYAGETEDPIAMKCDFLTSICETIMGGALSPMATNVIQRCGRNIYRPYYEHMRTIIQKKDENGNPITCDYEASPTLVDFYQALKAQGRLDTQEAQAAQILASSIEMYCVGNYDMFAKHTNINPKARFIVYDILDIPNNMKNLALQICLNDIWNRIIQNRKKGKRTWFYVDEFHLLLKNPSSAQFVQEIYKRARKWGGVPTGITQNVGDLLAAEGAEQIINLCDFILMMNQSQIDRAALSTLLKISETLQDYITDKPPGTGLLYAGEKNIVPFINQFPKGTKLYKIMSTKPGEEDDNLQTEIKEAKVGIL